MGRALYYTKQSADGQTQIVQYTYDEKNNLTGLTESVGSSTQDYVYEYDENERLISMTVGDTTVSYTYDDFRRLTQKVTTQGETEVKRETYTYVNPTATTTSTQIATYAVTVGGTTTTYTYTYDSNGNILSISDGTHTTSYVYDSANQLVRENNQEAGYTHTWAYDDAGNIEIRKEYTYTTVESLDNVTPNKTVDYSYDDGSFIDPDGNLVLPIDDSVVWADLLVGYDGQSVTYDEIGNPLTWGSCTFTWQHGRQLASLTEGTTTWNYTYDSNGMRTSRTNGTTTYNYTYNGSQLVQMTVGSDTLRFTYDAAGTPLTVTYNGTTYYYTTNLQGDVVGIVAADGTTVVTYSYDSWGKPLSTTGTLATTLGAENPLRYRGYVYDTETALYYLQTRYYDPVVGRFVNEDGYTSTGQGFVGNNMFAYCLNNPVKYIDIDGMDAGLLSAWAGGMWWICGVDTVLPVGDIIYVGGIVLIALLLVIAPKETTVIMDPVVTEDIDSPNIEYSEHTKNARQSTKDNHQKGMTRKQKDNGGEKGDKRRVYLGNKRRLRMFVLIYGAWFTEEEILQISAYEQE